MTQVGHKQLLSKSAIRQPEQTTAGRSNGFGLLARLGIRSYNQPMFPSVPIPILLRVCAATVAFGTTGGACALGCSSAVYAALGERMHVQGLANGDLVDAAACKRDPSDPRVTLVAVAWNDGHEKEYTKGFVVAEVDEEIGKVLALTASEVVADASTPLNGDELSIDTAPYVLAPGVRAFGVDVRSNVAHCADGGTELERTLYVREGKRLRPVLEHQPMAGGWIVDGTGCGDAEVKERFTVTIAVDPHISHYRRDLVTTTRFERTDDKPSTRKTEHIRIGYDGKSYASIQVQAPWELASRPPAQQP